MIRGLGILIILYMLLFFFRDGVAMVRNTVVTAKCSVGYVPPPPPPPPPIFFLPTSLH